jgi:hypothetical protein
MRFGTWNFMILYSLDSLERVSRQLVKFKLDTLTHRYSGSTGGFAYAKGNADHLSFYIHKKIRN